MKNSKQIKSTYRYSYINSMVKVLVAAIIVTMAACHKKECCDPMPMPMNCGEFLTTVKLTCINTNGTDTVIAEWRDLSPDDTVAPDASQAILSLKKNSVYKVSVDILDETLKPAGDIGADIVKRGNIYLLCFNASGEAGSNLTVAPTDLDTNNPPLPIGLQNKFTTRNICGGSLNVVLRHQPNIKNGSCEPGEVDLDVNFSVRIIN